MKKGKKIGFIEPTSKCYLCSEYHQNLCLVHEKNPEKCQRLIPYFTDCPNCREQKDGKRKYLIEAHMKFHCERCGQNYSVTFPDGDISEIK